MKMLLPKIVFFIVRMWSKTFRYEFYGQENRQEAIDAHELGTYIYAIWHENLLPGILSHTGFPHVVMTSASKDGDIAAYTCQQIGLTVARGSSKKEGMKALDHMIQIMKEVGIPAALTVDGPKGPRRKAKRGVILAARETKSKIVPYCILPEHYIEFSSWDRFKLPIPFSRVIIYFNKPLDCQFGNEEQLSEQLGRALDEGEEHIRRNYILHQL